MLKLNFKDKSGHLERLQEQNEQLEHEVHRYQERERYLEKVQILEKKRPWAVSDSNIIITAGYWVISRYLKCYGGEDKLF